MGGGWGSASWGLRKGVAVDLTPTTRTVVPIGRLGVGKHSISPVERRGRVPGIMKAAFSPATMVTRSPVSSHPSPQRAFGGNTQEEEEEVDMLLLEVERGGVGPGRSKVAGTRSVPYMPWQKKEGRGGAERSGMGGSGIEGMKGAKVDGRGRGR